jgi:hypothetical protein
VPALTGLERGASAPRGFERGRLAIVGSRYSGLRFIFPGADIFDGWCWSNILA